VTLAFPFMVIVALYRSFGLAMEAGSSGADYGLDCSWPVHNIESSCGDLLGDRKTIHDEYIRGCVERWGEEGAVRCNDREKERLETNRRQPQSMVVSDIDR